MKFRLPFLRKARPDITPPALDAQQPTDQAEIVKLHKLAEKRMLEQVKQGAPRQEQATQAKPSPPEKAPAGQPTVPPKDIPLKTPAVPEKPSAQATATTAKQKEAPSKPTTPSKPTAPPSGAPKAQPLPAQKEGFFEKEAARRRAAEEAELAKAQHRLKWKGPSKRRRERRTAQQQRRVLASLLVKAGFSQRPEKLHKLVFYIALIVIALGSLLTLIIAAASGKPAGGYLLFTLGLWTAIFAFVYLFIWMVIYLYLDIRIFQRTKELEDVLPDFLQLASANISAGMPIDRALWFAVRPNFGVLAREIEEVAKATLAGEELRESLFRFTEKYDSLTLRRSISILLEGVEAGGKIAELLTKIALNIQETKILRKEMSANVATYAIFITFASVVMAPILFALATELLVIIVKITSSLDLSGATSNFLTLNIKTSPEMITNFRWFSVIMLSISALMSASIVSVIRKGRVKEGVRNLPIFLAVSLLLYFFASSVLNAMLSTLI